MAFHSCLVVIRKSFLTNALRKCGLYPGLFQLPLDSILFCISLLFLCILRKLVIFILWLVSVFVQKLLKHNEEKQSHFIVILKIEKRCQTTSCHGLFLAWEYKQIWLLPNFFPGIDFTSFQFPVYEERQLSIFFHDP